MITKVGAKGSIGRIRKGRTDLGSQVTFLRLESIAEPVVKHLSIAPFVRRKPRSDTSADKVYAGYRSGPIRIDMCEICLLRVRCAARSGDLKFCT